MYRLTDLDRNRIIRHMIASTTPVMIYSASGYKALNMISVLKCSYYLTLPWLSGRRKGSFLSLRRRRLCTSLFLGLGLLGLCRRRFLGFFYMWMFTLYFLIWSIENHSMNLLPILCWVRRNLEIGKKKLGIRFDNARRTRIFSRLRLPC